jgi:hypothetical protein
MVSCLHSFNDLSLHADHFSGSVLPGCTALPRLNGTKLAGCDAPRKFLTRFAVIERAHSTVKHGLEDCSFVLNRRTLEDMIPCVRGSLLRCPFRMVLLLMILFSRSCHNAVSLMTELCCQYAVSP